MRYFVLQTICLVAVLLVVLVGHAVSADQGQISILSEEVTSQFPDGISFSLTLESSNPIDEVRVFYSYQESTTSYGYMEFEPTQPIQAYYLLSTNNTGSAGSFIPPGATFRYSFEVRDRSGNIHHTAQKEFVYLDSRFEWEIIEEAPITVYYYGPTEKRAQTILQASLQAVTMMSSVLGVDNVEPINIVAYNNYRHMALALPPRSQAVREGLVTEGQAFTDIRVLLVLAFVENIQGIASHEVTHVLIDDASGQGYDVMPLWLNEGLAELGNVDPTETYDNALLYGIYTRRLKPLWYLSTFAGDPDDILIAYGQSRSIVSYLANVYGHKKMAQFMTEMDNKLSVDEAMLEVYGFDQEGLDAEWRTQIGLSPLTSSEGSPSSTRSTRTSADDTKGLHANEPLSSDEDSVQSRSPGCNRGSGGGVSAVSDPFVLFLATSLVGMVAWGKRRRSEG